MLPFMRAYDAPLLTGPIPEVDVARTPEDVLETLGFAGVLDREEVERVAEAVGRAFADRDAVRVGVRVDLEGLRAVGLAAGLDGLGLVILTCWLPGIYRPVSFRGLRPLIGRVRLVLKPRTTSAA